MVSVEIFLSLLGNPAGYPVSMKEFLSLWKQRDSLKWLLFRVFEELDDYFFWLTIPNGSSDFVLNDKDLAIVSSKLGQNNISVIKSLLILVYHKLNFFCHLQKT